jgi:diaminopimelate epimerase
MGPARLDWREIPVRDACDTNHMPVGLGPLQDPVGTNMGNPHATFFVDDVGVIPIEELGPKLERDHFFPERANIGVAQKVGEGKLRLRVWERGTGLTLACGSGACAALVAASRRGLVGRKAEVVVDGGTLTIEWLRDGHVVMTGGIALAFKGELDGSLLI